MVKDDPRQGGTFHIVYEENGRIHEVLLTKERRDLLNRFVPILFLGSDGIPVVDTVLVRVEYGK